MSDQEVTYRVCTSFDREIAGHANDFLEAMEAAIHEHEADPTWDGNTTKLVEIFKDEILLYRLEHRGEWGRTETLRVMQESMGMAALAVAQQTYAMVQEIHAALVPPPGGLH